MKCKHSCEIRIQPYIIDAFSFSQNQNFKLHAPRFECCLFHLHSQHQNSNFRLSSFVVRVCACARARTVQCSHNVCNSVWNGIFYPFNSKDTYSMARALSQNSFSTCFNFGFSIFATSKCFEMSNRPMFWMKMKTEVEGMAATKRRHQWSWRFKGRMGYRMKEDTCGRIKGDGYDILLVKMKRPLNCG